MVRDIDQGGTGQDRLGTSHKSSTLVSVYEAADTLGVTVDAIRKRIQRGTIPHERHDDGRVYVILDKARTLQDDRNDTSDTVPDNDQDKGQVPYQTNDTLVEVLRDQVAMLRAELEDRKEESRRKDSIIMTLTQRVPELEALQDTQESSETASATVDEQPRATAEERQDPPSQRSWLYRFFFGPG